MNSHVDDRTIAGAQRRVWISGRTTEQFIDAFPRITGLDSRRSRRCRVRPTRRISLAMADMSPRSIGPVTLTEDGSVYFKISTLPTYGVSRASITRG